MLVVGARHLSHGDVAGGAWATLHHHLLFAQNTASHFLVDDIILYQQNFEAVKYLQIKLRRIFFGEHFWHHALTKKLGQGVE